MLIILFFILQVTVSSEISWKTLPVKAKNPVPISSERLSVSLFKTADFAL